MQAKTAKFGSVRDNSSVRPKILGSVRSSVRFGFDHLEFGSVRSAVRLILNSEHL